MTGEHAVTEQQATDDRLDPAGWAQLAFGSAVGIATAMGIGFATRGPFPWVTVVVLGVALAVVFPLSLLRRWWARGGRVAFLETRAWVRSGRVPDTVPDAVWRPRVRQLLGETTRQLIGAWVAVVVCCLGIVVAVSGEPRNWVLVVVWAFLAVFQFVRTRGQRAAATRLLDEPVRAVATV
jgi:hypothetical protein